MKIFNTVNQQSIIRLFEKKLAAVIVRPSANAETLFRKIAQRLLPLVRQLGLPTIQLFGLKQFTYGGRHFEIDVTWTYPDGAIDGVNASFMIENVGKGFQFILFDHQRGTILETWLGAHNLDAKIPALIKLTEQYCAQLHSPVP
jgi:hypothetical protein